VESHLRFVARVAHYATRVVVAMDTLTRVSLRSTPGYTSTGAIVPDRR
jgi:hypothetical protein